MGKGRTDRKVIQGTDKNKVSFDIGKGYGAVDGPDDSVTLERPGDEKVEEGKKDVVEAPKKGKGGRKGKNGKGKKQEVVEAVEEEPPGPVVLDDKEAPVVEVGLEDAGKGERAPWKRVGLATGVAIGINAAFLLLAFVPIVGIIIILMLVPYAAALIGGRFLHREKKGDWISATFWVVIIYPSILVLIMISFIRSLGSFELELEIYGGLIIGMLYVFPLVFSAIGFYQGAVPPDERALDEKVVQRLGPGEDDEVVLEKGSA